MGNFTGSEIFVELLAASGVDCIFYNPGFDVVPLLSAAARYKAAGKPAPSPVMCLDESTALHAAHGHYMVSGKLQVVLVHAELGTQQIGGAIQQAWWGRVPVLICAADMIAPGRVNWKGEPYDQAMMLRNCVKWDHRVGLQENFYDVLIQAVRTADSDPKGAVYLTYPLEVLSRSTEISSISAQEMDKLPEASAADLEKAADMLLNAENPLIVTGHLGRHHQAVQSLVELAETLGARVVTSSIRMNFPSQHPLCASLQPTDGAQSRPYFLDSDVVLAIDYDIPYAHPRTPPRPETRVIHIDLDFVKQGEPLWKDNVSLAIRADSSRCVPTLTDTIRQRMTAPQKNRAQERARRVQAENLKAREGYPDLGRAAAGQKPISAEWLMYCLNQVILPEDIVVNQVISPSASVARQVMRTEPGTLLACAGGTIGWALGAGLGAAIAAPGRVVVALMGDGAFVYGGPTAALWPAAFYKAPFLSIIFNNQAYGAIKSLFRGDWKEGISNSLIDPSPNYALTAQACGAYGKVVEDPAEVLPVLQEALQRVKAGQAAVLDVRIS